MAFKQNTSNWYPKIGTIDLIRNVFIIITLKYLLINMGKGDGYVFFLKFKILN